MVLGAMGEYVRACAHLECANSLDSPICHSIYGPGSLSWQGITLGCLGYPDQAVENSRRALVLAREMSDPLPYVNALNNAHHVRRIRREFEASLDLAEQTFRHASEHGFRQYSAFAMFNRGWALTQLDRSEEGIAQLREGFDAMRASGQPGFTIDYTALAEGFLKAGRTADGLAVVAEGLEASHRNHDGEQEAELWRIRGDLLLLEAKPGSENEAEGCFRQAIEIALHQQAKWWELRAKVSLAGLLVKRGRRDEAHSMLAEIYNWFTEGFDTADLRDAKALLDELSK
jgi:tetratricopeptide (TPR) repeat protein